MNVHILPESRLGWISPMNLADRMDKVIIDKKSMDLFTKEKVLPQYKKCFSSAVHLGCASCMVHLDINLSNIKSPWGLPFHFCCV